MIVLFLLEAHGRVRRDEVEVDLVSEQFSDIADTVPNREWLVTDTTTWEDNFGGRCSLEGTYLIMVGRSKLRPHP